jgi:hypothetical protein
VSEQEDTTEPRSASYDLTRAFAVQLRLNGLIFDALVKRGVLTREEAAGYIAEAASYLPDGNPFEPVFESLLQEFL